MKFINQYQIIGLLGVGGMGRVYKVRMPVAGRVVALKRLEPREELEMLLGEDEVADRFLSEVRLLGQLGDPNVAGVLDVGRDEQGRWFYTMDYCCLNLGLLLGEDYEGDQVSRSLPVDTAVRYGLHMLSGLAHLHHHNIVHRDIKPFNLLIAPGDVLQIIDFGLSKVRGEARWAPGGLKIGTPFYAAPEQESDPETVDDRADLYSAGVVLWRMLTGHMVAERPDLRVAPSTQAPELGPAFDDFLRKATAPLAEDRYPDANAMAQALEDAHDDWKDQLAEACAVDEAALLGQDAAQKLPTPRSAPQKIRPGQAREALGVDGLHRPRQRPDNSFSPSADGLSVHHAATGLTWQKAGSPYGMEWPQAAQYVASLNQGGFGGRSDWRLPTAAELLTLLSPERKMDDYCTPQVFSTRQRWQWSADTKSFCAAWFVDAKLGFAAFADHTCLFFVRAVAG